MRSRGVDLLPRLAQVAQGEGVRLGIRIDGPASRVVIQDSRGGMAWVDAHTYLDALGAERHGDADEMASGIWAQLCKSRKPGQRSYRWSIDDRLLHDPPSIPGLQARVAATIKKGRTLLESVGR